MNNIIRKLFHKIHLYLSLPFGIVISVICLTGAVLVFEDDIMMAVRHDLYYVESADGMPLPAEKLLQISDSVIDGKSKITGITAFGNPERAYMINLSYPRRAVLFIDQYTGKVLGTYEQSPFFSFVLRLHRWLLHDRTDDVQFTVGRRIVGLATLSFVVILVSGLVIWFPRNIKSLKNRLFVVCSKGYRRFFYDLHVSAGFYSTLILLILALTGLTWSFPVYRSFVYDVIGDEKETKFDLALPDNEYTDSYIYEKWNDIFNILHDRDSRRTVTVSYGKADVDREGWGNQYASDTYMFDMESGKITSFVPYEDKSRSVKIKGWILSLHTGIWGGMFSKILVSVISLLGVTFPLTGYYLWIRKKKRH